MMWGWNYNYGLGKMMGDSWFFYTLCLAFWMIVSVDLILLGVWLWKQINKR